MASATTTLTVARSWTSRAIRDGGDTSMYANADLDRAIAYAGNHFCRETKSVKGVATLSITDGDDSPTLTTATAAGFTPERRIDAIVVGEEYPLKFIDYADLNTLYANDEDAEGVPEYLAFLDDTTIRLFPEPDAAYTCYLRFWKPFQILNASTGAVETFTPGQADGTPKLNIADEWTASLCADGAAAVLLFPSGDKREGSGMWARFLQTVERAKGSGSLGARLVERRLPTDRSRREAREFWWPD